MGVKFELCNPLGLSFELIGCNLTAASFHALDMRRVRFEKCNAQAEGVCFNEVVLKGALFEQTNLKAADFTLAAHWRIDPNENSLQKAKFRKEELSGLLASWSLDITFALAKKRKKRFNDIFVSSRED